MTAKPDIDVWIKEFGLDAEVDRIMRTCGYDAVKAAVDGAPARFKKRGEPLKVSGPGRPSTRSLQFYETVWQLVSGFKIRHPNRNNKEACSEVARHLRNISKRSNSAELLRLLGLSDVASLNEATLYREFNRVNPERRIRLPARRPARPSCLQKPEKPPLNE
jgi:hypothetical protein